MNTYTIKLEITAEVEAFTEEDAKEYISDIFSVDDEIKQINVVNIKEK